MPALFFMVLAFAVVEGVWNVLGDRDRIGNSIIVALTYTMNVPGLEHGSSALSHLWTLATEEQFYLLWPVVLALGIRWRRPVMVTCLGIVGALGICGISILVVYPETFKIYSLPTSWVAAMLIGAGAKLPEARLSRIFAGSRAKVAALLALGALLALSFAPEAKDWPGTYLVIGPLIAVCTLPLVFECKSWVGVPTAALKPLHWLGTVSYAANLWNYPIAIGWEIDRSASSRELSQSC